ncbi:hypothetical protein [Bradyrhizobium sp. Ec3.3]|uniref:hypothetical protein n=1 Tax=Bradyrhizobium sp. Ec3.3 TaxID=189753 RepID=UPI000486DDD9|nr:hypothetical protein [Bradyrhizobium sp. Ec3.3]
MLTALLLICSAAVVAESHECTRIKANTVLRVPAEFGNPATSFMQAQAYLAENPIGHELDANERVKVICVRSEMIANAPTHRR